MIVFAVGALLAVGLSFRQSQAVSTVFRPVSAVAIRHSLSLLQLS